MLGIYKKLVIIGVLLMFTAVVPFTAMAADKPSGQPFLAIWAEIDNIYDALDSEAAAREAADDDLQGQIDDLGTRLDNEKMPLGAILMWSGTIDANGNPIIGASADTNWHLCDGTEGTPDLRDRFVVGAGSSYAIGNTGGANSVTLTVDQIPKHSHSFSGSTSSDGAHTHTYKDRSEFGWDSADHGSKSVAQDSWQDLTRTTSSAGAHTHTFSGTTASVGGGDSHENRPPYFALAYIMKVDE